MQTLRDVLRAMFPFGTGFPEILGWRSTAKSKPDYGSPFWPPDLFAFVAKLLDLSGAYHHIVPSNPAPPMNGLRRIQVSEVDRESCRTAGKEWRDAWGGLKNPPERPALVEDLWAQLTKRMSAQIYVSLNDFADPPEWWKAAHQLLMVADEASYGLGFDLTKPSLSSIPDNRRHFLDIFKVVLGSDVDKRDGLFDENFLSVSFANVNIASVMPKSRTPRVGCTLRSLSHNLALLPPRGEVRVRWGSYDRDPGPALDQPLKLLIIPFPYAIADNCFSVAGATPGRDESWGWFQVEPHWLGPASEMDDRAIAFADFAVDLVEQASKDPGGRVVPVAGVVIPEAALNETYYLALASALEGRCPNVEFLINGSSDGLLREERVSGSKGSKREPDRIQEGNFVNQSLFFSSSGNRHVVRTTRQKHHRWRLDRAQILAYRLQKILDPDKLWWERIDITSRSVDVMAFRAGATVTSLICEDLARVDPCQAAVRAVGPTLLVSLLMDGSQLAGRWPGRYATILSEDPGCSVLTVTSLGLISRTDPALVPGGKPSQSIGLWRDSAGAAVELILDDGAHGVCFTVHAAREAEQTLDGRSSNDDVVVWRLDQSNKADMPRSVTAAKTPPSWVLDGD